jgi:Ran GTPase-activating protein (RanGAP) involved in mRNA processing and transport
MALAIKRTHTLEDVDLSCNELGAEGCIAIADALRINDSLQCLNLYCNGVRDDGALALAHMLRKNSCLRILNLSCNAISPVGVKDLCEALKMTSQACQPSLTTLRVFNLSRNGLREDGALYVADMLSSNSSLQCLDLCQSDIPDSHTAAKAFSHALANNTSLLTLKLCRNRIGDVFACELAHALEKNKTLRVLDLSYNDKVTSEGALAIITSLKVNPRFHALTLRGVELHRAVGGMHLHLPPHVICTSTQDLLDFFHAQHQESFLAFLMGGHARLGSASLIRCIGADALPLVACAYFGVSFTMLMSAARTCL